MKNIIVHSENGKNLLCSGNVLPEITVNANSEDFVVRLKSIGKSYVLSGDVSCKSSFECSIKWLKKEEAIRTDVFAHTSVEKKIFRLFYSPPSAESAIITFKVKKQKNIIISNLKFSQELVSGFGEIMDVSGIEDINEPLNPNDYWNLFPKLKLSYKGRKIHLNPLLQQFFDVGFVYELDFGFDVINKTKDFMSIPVKYGMLGKESDKSEPYIIAGDIKHNPVLRTCHAYSTRYYPRRHQDYLGLYFFPAYILSKDEKYLIRAKELLDFFKYSRWEKDGSNQFVQELYSDEYSPHPEWFGGFDYQFDWEWLDAYGYLWKLHEPDHHVNSAIASTFVTAFQLTGNREYYNYAFDFVYNQMPRYGFHKGVYKGQTYYFTEYNPTGLSLGNPVTDATDNVVSLAASACATVGYYIQDTVLQGQFLELARGLLWYLVREYNYDKWFYYDGAENPLNPRRCVSHDIAAMRFAFSALSYLYKAGADIDSLLKEFTEIDKNITKNSKEFKSIGHFRLYKIYEGDLNKGNNIQFTTFVKVKTEGVKKAVFSDNIPQGFESADFINVRISKINPPNENNVNFAIDQDVVYRVSKEQLQSGIEIPFKLNRGNEFKISYEIRCNKNFDMSEKSTDSKINATILSESGEYQTEATTSNSVIGDITYSMPLSMKISVNSSNFLSLAAMMNYPFADETGAVLIDTQPPEAEAYLV